MPYQVNASYSQAWETVYKRFLEKAQPASMPAREFTTLETIEQAHAYVINEIDHFRRDCYTDSISSALGSWATDHPESWKIDPENQKVMPRIPVRIFDWGSGPGIASAFFANYYLNYQVELDAITLVDIGAPAIDAGAEILQIMFGERYPQIHKVADNILNVTKENFERRNIDVWDPQYMNLHLAFFSLDLLGYSKERFIQQTLANFGSKNFFLVIVPSSRNGTTVRDFVRTFCEQDIAWRWNIRAYTCDKHGPRLEEAFTGGRR